MTNTLVQLLAKVSRGSAETRLCDLFVILGLAEAESSLAKVLQVENEIRGLGLRIVPPVTRGELDSTRRIEFVDDDLVSVETFRAELLERECDTVELKSSLMFDHKKASLGDKVPKSALNSEEVLHSSLKTIAAFLTSAGGSLFIGVDDAGVIVGIQYDFCCISDIPEKQNVDGWELKLRSLIAGRFKDGALVNDYVKCSVLELEGYPVARLRVFPRRQLSFLKPKGTEPYALYRRQGNQTVSVSVDQVEEFLELRKRWFE